ncbi:MAG TPA: beta-galactosidase [Rikenellaceae bacterium]|nr:beta-galactosidase [Rikenellaceae bacterium]
MKKYYLTLAAVFTAIFMNMSAQPCGSALWNEGWTFTKDGGSRILNLPHDWGVDGPFVQEYPGESGKLAWWGKAEYSKTLSVKAKDLKRGKRFFLDFGGAMSYAKVFCNGKYVTEWPYGYSSFRADLTPFLKAGDNLVKVTLDNPEESSRWYPGGGIYRNVYLTVAEPVGVAQWGTFVTTKGNEVSLDITLRNSGKEVAGTVRTEIFKVVNPALMGASTGSAASAASVTEPVEVIDAVNRQNSPTGKAKLLTSEETTVKAITDGCKISQRFTLEDAEFWSLEHPALYQAFTTVTTKDGRTDLYRTTFGLRDLEYKADGLYVNGEKTFIKGVCLHHDAGALGAVWNETAWIRRLNMLKDMGCNAIRTSHNPPAPELLDLCDRMGFLVMDELTDTWTIAKKKNGYAKLFDKWADKDLKAMIRRDRNHPSVIMWSIGNETAEQGYPEKYGIAYHLTEVCHNEDPTRLTSYGSDNPWASEQDFRNTMDIYGFNYKPHLYGKFHAANPGKLYLGSETASTVSSRGVYIFPLSNKEDGALDNFQVCSFDMFTVPWGQLPDQEWAEEDRNPSCLGEFVWTGFDYLGEPTPYNTDLTILTNFHDEEARAKAEKELAEKGTVATPSRSSYFGIIDLAGFPKDRYWLYKSRWSSEPVLHLMPHWNCAGREGQVTPVQAYTNCVSAELFVNGKSYGRKTKGDKEYRFLWDNVIYEPGTVKIIGQTSDGQTVESIIRTTGSPEKILMACEYGRGPSTDFGGDCAPASTQTYSSEDIIFVDVKIADSHGDMVPTACDKIKFSVSGAGEIVAVDAGDATCHTPFHSDEIKAFNGLASVIVRRTKPGAIAIKAESDGMEAGELVVR